MIGIEIICINFMASTVYVIRLIHPAIPHLLEDNNTSPTTNADVIEDPLPGSFQYFDG